MKFRYPVMNLIMVLVMVLSAFARVQTPVKAAGTVSITALGSAYTENFDTLAASGTSSTLPNGWWIAEAGTSSTVNGSYTAGTGSGNAGDTYSFGATASSERALGGLLSGTFNTTIGASYTNNSGAPIEALSISYTGEMWRAGLANRGAADRLDFQYSLDATSLTTGTWVDFNALDFNSPNITSNSGALDGNLAGNRSVVTATISGLNIPNATSFWIRWKDYDISSSDDGLAVDDFSLTALSELGPSVTSVSPVNGATYVSPTANMTVNFSEPVNAAGSWFSIVCSSSGAHTATVSGGPQNFTLNPDVDFATVETCDVTIIAAQVTDQDTNDPPDAMAANYVWSFNVNGNDPAPTVTAVTPLNGATGVAMGANLTVSFSEPVNVADGWYGISCATSSAHTAAVTGGPTAFTLNPNSDFAANEVCTVTLTAAKITDQDTVDPYDAMLADYVWSFTTTACGGPATLIHDIQGPGLQSPIAGSVVTIEGIVTGDYQGTGQFSGFFVQEEDADADADPATSEGIFVFNTAFAVNPGEKVRLTGTVTEYLASSVYTTQLGSLTGSQVCSTGNTVTPALVTLPVATLDNLEAFEGMLVVFPQQLTVTETFTLGRYGEVALSVNGRLLNPTSIAEPGAPAIAQQALNDRSRILLDDGSNVQNPPSVIYPFPELSAANTLRSGYTTVGLTGVMEQRFGVYRIQPVAPVSPAMFVPTNPRTPAPSDPGGTLKIASYNMLNYFNGDGLGGGFPTARGAETLEEFNRQRVKIIDSIIKMDADILGLMEFENDAPGNSAIEDLVSGLNAATVPGTYSFINTGIIGTDQIRDGLVYKTASVTPFGDYKVLDTKVDPTYWDTRNRPSLAQTFSQNSNGARITVDVNHLKSKGSSCATTAGDPMNDPDTGDGQGNCNISRTLAAQAIVNWLATDPTGSGSPNFIIIGDMNAYAKEDPIDAIIAGGYTDLIHQYMGDNAYSYVYGGQSGYLDHALSSAALTPQVVGASHWHINADEPIALDYNTNFKSAGQIISYYAPDAYRSSDHDPVMVGLNLLPPLAVTDLDLWQTTTPDVPASWVAVPGSFATGFKLVLDPTVEYYYLDTNSITANRPLADGMYPFYVGTTPLGFFDYWATRGVNGTGSYTEPWQPVMWEIINGRQPIFLLKVAGTDYTLVDGLQYLGGQELPLRINGAYPLGAYTFTGEVADVLGSTDALTVPIEFLAPLAVTDLDLWQTTTPLVPASWVAVPGSYAAGFKLVLDPTVPWYYLDTNSITSNRPLANGMYPFYVGTTPLDFFAYWATRGVTATGPYTEPWQPVMWEIINGRQPIFYLKVAGTDYTLVDGLQYLGGQELPLRINGDYLLGAYTFTGEVADALGAKDTVTVPIEFIEPLAVTDLDLWQSVVLPTWTQVPGNFASGFTMVLDPAVAIYYLDTNSITVNRPLADVYHPFFVGTTPAGFFTYWNTRGVNSGATPGTWQAMMWEIINGRQPIFYLKVSGAPLAPVGDAYMLVDGLTKLMGGGDTPLRIEGSYLPGVYTFTGNVMDNYGYKDAVSVQITFNDLPKANSQSVSTPEETALPITLTAVDLFPGTLNWIIVDQPQHGVLSGTAPNVTYTPALNYNGTDSFTFKVNDGTSDSNVATISITATFVNDAPTLAGNIPDQETLSYKPYAYTFGATLFNDLDLPYGDVLTYSATLADGSPLPAWLTFDPATRTFSGVPGQIDVKTWHIKVTATDKAAASVSTTFNLKVTWVWYIPLISK